MSKFWLCFSRCGALLSISQKNLSPKINYTTKETTQSGKKELNKQQHPKFLSLFDSTKDK